MSYLCIRVCVCGWVCLFLCAMPVIHWLLVWIHMKGHNPIITTARGVCPNDFWFKSMCVSVWWCLKATITTKHKDHSRWLLRTALIYQHCTLRRTRSSSRTFAQIRGSCCSSHAELSSIIERSMQSKAVCHWLSQCAADINQAHLTCCLTYCSRWHVYLRGGTVCFISSTHLRDCHQPFMFFSFAWMAAHCSMAVMQPFLLRLITS